MYHMMDGSIMSEISFSTSLDSRGMQGDLDSFINQNKNRNLFGGMSELNSELKRIEKTRESLSQASSLKLLTTSGRRVKN